MQKDLSIETRVQIVASRQTKLTFPEISKTTISAEALRQILRRRKLIGRAAAKKAHLRQKSRIERLKWCAARKDPEVS